MGQLSELQERREKFRVCFGWKARMGDWGAYQWMMGRHLDQRLCYLQMDFLRLIAKIVHIELLESKKQKHCIFDRKASKIKISFGAPVSGLSK